MAGAEQLENVWRRQIGDSESEQLAVDVDMFSIASFCELNVDYLI